MNTKFAKANFEVWLREKWTSLDVSLDNNGRLGLSIPEIVEVSFQRTSQETDPYFDLWIAIFDEFVSWLISVEIVWRCEILEKRHLTSFEKSIALLLVRIVSDSLAIRQLLISGFDTSAQALVRSAGEHIEILVAVINDHALAEAFEKTRTPVHANNFWKLHISNNKIRPRIKSLWMELSGGDQRFSKFFANWGNLFYDELCAFSHPSLFGCGRVITPVKSAPDDEWLSMFGDKSLLSIGTIQVYISYFFHLIGVTGDFPFISSPDQHGSSISYDDKSELHQHIKKGRSVLSSLVLSLNAEFNRKYIYPEENIS